MACPRVGIFSQRLRSPLPLCRYIHGRGECRRSPARRRAGLFQLQHQVQQRILKLGRRYLTPFVQHRMESQVPPLLSRLWKTGGIWRRWAGFASPRGGVAGGNVSHAPFDLPEGTFAGLKRQRNLAVKDGGCCVSLNRNTTSQWVEAPDRSTHRNVGTAISVGNTGPSYG